MQEFKINKSEYDMFVGYIDEAIGLLLRKNEDECMRVLETLKLLNHSILNIKNLFNEF